jgi:dynein heavy chain
MMVPNYALIAEIMLFAEGFGDAKNLSRKMCKLYILCSEQLSQQPHYDYGLRAVKSVLVMAGGLKRSNPNTPEDLVLIRALRDSNVPKFLADDLPLFAAIGTHSLTYSLTHLTTYSLTHSQFKIYSRVWRSHRMITASYKWH